MDDKLRLTITIPADKFNETKQLLYDNGIPAEIMPGSGDPTAIAIGKLNTTLMKIDKDIRSLKR